MKTASPFVIQPGHVKMLKATAAEDDSFRDLFPKMFSEHDESMYLFWKGIPIRFHYTFDCFASMGNCIHLLNEIATTDNGNQPFFFVTNVLSAKWQVNWNKSEVSIQSEWRGKKGFEKYAENLNTAGELKLDREAFLAEWKLPLIQVLNMVDAAKARNINDSIETKVQQAGKILQSVETFGQIYEKP